MRFPSIFPVRRARRAVPMPIGLARVVPPLVLTAAVVGLSNTGPLEVEWRRPLALKAADEPTAVAASAPAKPTTTCSPEPSTPVPDMVGAIFRCRLREAGFDDTHVRQITAEAVTVAACESHFDPGAVVFDGRYRDVPHPSTGARHSATGVFQFIRDRADRWIQGGYANAADPIANIDAAARVYVHNARRGYAGWSDWACAAANDGFRATSVLPGWPGGPAQLPAWSWEH